MRGKFFEQFISEGFFWNVGKRYWKIDCYSATGDSLQQITQVNRLLMSIIMHYIPTQVSGIAGVWKQWRRSYIKIFICLNLITISLAFTDGGRFNPGVIIWLSV